MKEFKGTKGPWSLPHFANDSCSCDCGFVLVEGHCGAVANVYYSKDNSVQNGDNPNPSECIANAKLIAAAPKTLGQLQKIHELSKKWGRDWFSKDELAILDETEQIINQALD